MWITVPVRLPNVTSLKIISAEKHCATKQTRPLQGESNMLLQSLQTTVTPGVTAAFSKSLINQKGQRWTVLSAVSGLHTQHSCVLLICLLCEMLTGNLHFCGVTLNLKTDDEMNTDSFGSLCQIHTFPDRVCAIMH